jgi:hypothetical protein
VTSAVSQLRALIWIRWQMIRSPRVRAGLVASGVLVVALLVLMVRSAPLLSNPALVAAVALAPAAYLGFGINAVVAPLTAGCGVDIVPSSQLVAFPVRPATQFLGGLVLAPVNLVWVAQLLTLAAESAYLTVDGHFFSGGVITALFVLCVTALGQMVAWGVVGLRQSHRGRRLVAIAGAVVLVSAFAVIRLDRTDDVIAASPTAAVVRTVGSGIGLRWALVAVTLAVLTVLGLLAGSRACAWALQLPADIGSPTLDRRVSRRRESATAFRALVAVDRASVWRAAALRRGGLVLLFLPGLMAIGAAISWESLAVLPGLVGAGAGLLFGVNAFSLDGSGAIWLASLPHDPLLAARAKVRVLAETVLAAAVIAVVAGSLRSPGTPTTTQVVAILASTLSCCSLIIATCMAMSVRHPHRADLRGPRDAVAPPGALAAASARLALPAGLLGLLFAGVSASGIWWLPAVLGAPVVLAAAWWLSRSLARYGVPLVRAGIVATVAAG